MLGLSAPLNSAPFWDPDTQTDVVPLRAQVSIAGRPFFINLDEYQHLSVETKRAAQDTTAEPSEASLSIGGFWARHQQDWSLGAGQRRFDVEGSSRRRFLASKGVDVWEPSELRLLNSTRKIASASSENLFQLTVGNYAYMADGTNLRFTPNPFDALPIIGTAVGTEPITAIATDGIYIYAATMSGIFRTTVGATSLTLFSAFPCELVAYANGRLFASMSGRVVEVSASGVAGGLGQLDDSSKEGRFRVTAAIPAPNGVYFAAQSGAKPALFFVGTNTQTGESLPLVWAGEIGEGETIIGGTFYGGGLWLGTDRGFHIGVITGNDSIVPGKLVAIPGGVSAFEGQGDYVWFSWSNYDADSTGLGRAGLGEFTEPYVAAYASDLMASTQGKVVGIATFGDRRLFSVAGDGWYVEDTSLVPSGVMDTGEVSWGTVVQKSAAALDLRHLPLHGEVDAALVLEDGTVMPVGTSVLQGTLGPGKQLELFDAEGEAVRLQLTLRRSPTDATLGPVVRRWTMSAFIRPVRQEKFVVPVRLFTHGVDLDQVKIDIPDTREAWDFLKSLERSGALVAYVLGRSVYRVQVDAVEMRNANRWNDMRTFFDAVAYVSMTTQETAL